MAKLPPPTEIQFREMIKQDQITFPPFELKWEKNLPPKSPDQLTLTWKAVSFRFAVHFQRLSNPKSLLESMLFAQLLGQETKLFPLVIVPYLSQEGLAFLESKGVSGFDLCGNGYVFTPGGEWLVRQTGKLNRFGQEATIKNIYRLQSSVVARLFLSRPRFESVQDAQNALARLTGKVTLSTISKVCQSLADDQVIERNRLGTTSMKLVHPEKLLDLLEQNYSLPKIAKKAQGIPVGMDSTSFQNLMEEWMRNSGGQLVYTAQGALKCQAPNPTDDLKELYCSNCESLLSYLGERFQLTDQAPEYRFLETPNGEVFFDRRGNLMPSPLQIWLEESSGDNPDQHTLTELRKKIIDEVPVNRTQ